MSILGRLIRFFTLIDLQALSGVNRMLGLTMEEGRIHVTEVVRKGNPFRKLSARFEVTADIEVQMVHEDTLEEKGKKVAEALEHRGVRTKSTVVGLRTQGIRSTETATPQGVRDIDRWIRERMADLLKLPVAGEQFQFRQGRGNEGSLWITFARESEVDVARKLLVEAGLSPFAIVPESEVASHEVSALFPSTAETKPSLAGLLAVAGFLPELIRVDFLSSGERENRDTGTAKNLFRRVALATGTLLLILLLAETIAERHLAGGLWELEERNLALMPRLEKVEELEGQVSALETRLGDRTSHLSRTDVSRILHSVAAAAPKDVRFSRVRFQEEGAVVVLSGFAESQEAVTHLLKGLAGRFSDTQLIRIGTPRQGMGGVELVTVRDRCAFEVRMTWRGGK